MTQTRAAMARMDLPSLLIWALGDCHGSQADEIA